MRSKWVSRSHTLVAGSVLSEDSLKRWVELELPGGVRASVSNARTEKYSKPGGKPQIAPATIHEDLMRRDFTINAMALSLNRGSRGLLIDPTNGQADLVNRELRTTNAYALFDDPSRIFRLIRFQYVLGFEIAPRTQSQIENALMGEYHKAAPVSRSGVGDPGPFRKRKCRCRHWRRSTASDCLKMISPALTGAKLNAAGSRPFRETGPHRASRRGTRGGWLAFLTVLTEKMNPRDNADLLRAFELSKAEADALKKLEARRSLESTLKSPRITKPSHVYDALDGVTPMKS